MKRNKFLAFKNNCDDYDCFPAAYIKENIC